MAKKKVSQSNIKEELKKNKYVIGTKSVMKNLKAGKLEKVYIASNCDINSKKDIENYTKISKTPLFVLNQPNDELGIICKKQYSISMLGILKE